MVSEEVDTVPNNSLKGSGQCTVQIRFFLIILYWLNNTLFAFEKELQIFKFFPICFDSGPQHQGRQNC